MHLMLVLNRDAGSLRGTDVDLVTNDLAEIFRSHGHDVEAKAHEGAAVLPAIAAICRAKRFDAVVVGGGDGTVSAAAGMAAESGLTLGILPLGTMNLFARSLAIPLDMRKAAEALAAGSPVRVDIAKVNDRFFIHHVTLGLHPRMIRLRERLNYASRLGKIWASLLTWWTVVRQPPSLSVSIRADERTFERRTAALLVSNNPLGEGHLPYPDDLRQGKLGIYVARSRHWRDLLELAARMTLGEISNNPLLESIEAKTVEIALSQDVVNVSLDGEIVSLTTPLRCTMHARRLTVLKPRVASEAAVQGASSELARVGGVTWRGKELRAAARVGHTNRAADRIA